MKVLHVIPSVSAKHGGPSVAIRALAQASAAAGIEVTVVTTDDDGNDARLPCSLGEAIPESGGEYWYFKRDVVAYKISFSAAGWLTRNVGKFDVVHVHAVFSFLSTVAMRRARRRNVPYVVRPLGVLNRWGLQNRRALAKRASLRLIELPLLKDASAIHYTSEAERLEASALPGLANVRAVVMPLPIFPQPIGNAEQFRQLFPQARGRCILFLSRIDRKKGLELLLDAFATLKAKIDGLVLVVAGEGKPSYLDELRVRAKALGIDEEIIWTGHLTGEEKSAAFAAASLFVLPSSSENFGVAAAEALAAGIPTVVSREVALSADVESYDAGVVVQRDGGELALAMQKILEEPETAARFSQNGVRLVQERYSPEAVGTELRDLYQSILSKRGGRR